MEDLDPVQNEFCSYLDHWKCLAKIEFEAELGEVDGSAGDDQVAFVRGATMQWTESRDTVLCSWAEDNNAGIHGFAVDSKIWLSRSHPQRDAASEPGVVVAWNRCWAVIRFRDGREPKDVEEGVWRIDGDYVTHGLDWILAGLSRFVSRQAEALQQLIVLNLTEQEAADFKTRNRPRVRPTGDIGGVCAKHQLNDSQTAAVSAAASNVLSLVQGPPGTGKTETIMALLEVFGRSGEPSCALSGGNVAVDNLCTRALARNLKTVRTGNAGSDKASASLHHVLVEVIAGEKCGWGKNQRAQAKRRQWARDYIQECVSVVCSTCTTVCANYLDGVSFGAMVIDEAGQVTEVDTVASLSRCVEGGIGVLVGDQLQLPCSIKSKYAVRGGMDTSCLERLMGVPYVQKTFLDTQYRMHPSIRKWPSEMFYDDRLKDSVGVQWYHAPPGFRWLPGQNVAFVHTCGAEEKVGYSFRNRAEVLLVVQVVTALSREGNVAKNDI